MSKSCCLVLGCLFCVEAVEGLESAQSGGNWAPAAPLGKKSGWGRGLSHECLSCYSGLDGTVQECPAQRGESQSILQGLLVTVNLRIRNSWEWVDQLMAPAPAGSQHLEGGSCVEGKAGKTNRAEEGLAVYMHSVKGSCSSSLVSLPKFCVPTTPSLFMDLLLPAQYFGDFWVTYYPHFSVRIQDPSFGEGRRQNLSTHQGWSFLPWEGIRLWAFQSLSTSAC